MLQFDCHQRGIEIHSATMARLLLEEKYISSTAIIRKDASSEVRSAPSTFVCMQNAPINYYSRSGGKNNRYEKS